MGTSERRQRAHVGQCLTSTHNTFSRQRTCSWPPDSAQRGPPSVFLWFPTPDSILREAGSLVGKHSCGPLSSRGSDTVGPGLSPTGTRLDAPLAERWDDGRPITCLLPCIPSTPTSLLPLCSVPQTFDIRMFELVSYAALPPRFDIVFVATLNPSRD